MREKGEEGGDKDWRLESGIGVGTEGEGWRGRGSESRREQERAGRDGEREREKRERNIERQKVGGRGGMEAERRKTGKGEEREWKG